MSELSTTSTMVEFRGIWVPHWEMDDAAKIRTHCERAARMNANAMLFQVVARGDAYYNSTILPRAERLTDPNLDPLAEALKAAQEFGLQAHAWINALLVWTSSTKPKSPDHVVNKHPEWLMVDPGCVVQFDSISEPDRDYEGGYYLDPGLVPVRDHLLSVYKEVLDNYAVDGVHFDYIRHPNRVGKQATRLSYLADTVNAFKLDFPNLDPCGGGNPCDPNTGSGSCQAALEWTAEWDQWREDRVTLLVRSVDEAVRNHPIRSAARVSAATLARWDIGLGRSFTSGRSWVAAGDLDFICPMCYFTNTEWVVHYTKALLEVVDGSRVYTGLAAFLNDKRELARQIEAVRAAGAMGQIIFSASDLDNGTINVIAGSDGPWSQPATPPAVGHRTLEALIAPPRPVPMVTLGELVVTSRGNRPGTASLSRDFYVRGKTDTAETLLHIEQDTSNPITGIELEINGTKIQVPDGTAIFNITPYVDPFDPNISHPYTDNHTSAMTITGTGKNGANAIFRIEDKY